MVVLPPQLRVLTVLAAVVRWRRQDERGASAVEYGLMVAGIAAVIVGAVFLFGQGIFSELFQETCDSIASNMPGGCT